MLSDFFVFYQDALKASLPDERAAITVGAAIRDVLGEEMAQGWFKRLERHKAMLEGARFAGSQNS